MWGAIHETYLKPVFISQRKAMRAITFSGPIAHTSLLFYDLQILKLEDIYIVFTFLSFAYECVNDIAPIHFRDYFTQISEFHQYNTRSASCGDLFLVRKSTVQYGSRSVCFNWVKSWNTVPSDIRNSPSVSIFKRKHKNFLLL